MTDQQADDVIAEAGKAQIWLKRIAENGRRVQDEPGDDPHPLATAADHAERTITALLERVSRQPQEVELLRAIRADASAYQWHAAIDTLADGGSLKGPSRLGASPEDRIHGAKSAAYQQIRAVLGDMLARKCAGCGAALPREFKDCTGDRNHERS